MALVGEKWDTHPRLTSLCLFLVGGIPRTTHVYSENQTESDEETAPRASQANLTPQVNMKDSCRAATTMKVKRKNMRYKSARADVGRRER